MKRIFLLCFAFSIFIGKAQDTLILNNSDKILSLVLTIGKDSIRYKTVSELPSPDMYIKNIDVKLVKYGNGAVVNVDSLYTEQHSIGNRYISACAVKGTPEQMLEKGRQDADVNYLRPHYASIITGVALSFMGPFGVIPACAIMFIPPSEDKLDYPCKELWQDKDYRKGYKQRAWKLKRHRIGPPVGLCIILSNVIWSAALR